MPRERSMKHLLGETVLFVSMFALAGHLSINIWERYVIQSELSHMKCIMYSLKKTVNNIGNAYDNLQNELKGLKETAVNKLLQTGNNKESTNQCKNIQSLNQKPHNFQARSVPENKNKSCLTDCNEAKNIDKVNKKHISLCDATTITRYPTTSTKVGSDLEHSAGETNCPYITCDNKLRQCYKDWSERQNPKNNWKF